MTMVNYETSPFPVREDLADAHRRAWARLGGAGTWLTAEERIHVAFEVRNAPGCKFCEKRKSAISPYAVKGTHDSLGELTENWVEVVHRVMSDPGRITHKWVEDMLESGISDGHYVEIVSVIAHVVAIDTFTSALGSAPHDLPEPAAGAPTRYRPVEARVTDAWVPTIVWEEAGPNEADFFTGPGSNIRRAITLVPDEARSFFNIGHHQYWPKEAYHDLTSEHRAISRELVEVIAGRISALNQCTY